MSIRSFFTSKPKAVVSDTPSSAKRMKTSEASGDASSPGISSFFSKPKPEVSDALNELEDDNPSAGDVYILIISLYGRC